MYKYVYKRIEMFYEGWGPLGGNVFLTENHQETINKMAEKGYRYIGFIPVKQRGTGHIEIMDLIFEKEIDKK